MNPRTIWLTLAASGIGLLYGGDTAYRTYIEKPSTEYEQQLTDLEGELRDAETDERIAKKKLREMDALAARSLPSEPELARSAYQAYLLDLVEKHRWESRSIDTGNPALLQIKSRTARSKKRSIGYTLRVSLHGQATLAQLVSFLREFEDAPHLQQITDLSLNPLGNGTSLDIQVQIEALGLNAADRKDALSTWVRDPESIIDVNLDQRCIKRNLFARGTSKALEEIKLKAITYDKSGKPQAWFQVKPNQPAQILSMGEVLEMASYDVQLIEVESDRVCVSLNQQKGWMELGQSLSQLK